MSGPICPACGHRAMAGDRCGVCGWDDAAYDDWHGAREKLLAAQRAFAKGKGLRAATADEARPSWWRSLDDTPAALVDELRTAFAGVTLDGGPTLAQANALDGRREPPPATAERPWTALTRADLDVAPSGVFPFMDARSLRYHLPVYLIADLRRDAPPAAIESLLFLLSRTYRQVKEMQALLTDAQRAAVARWLAFEVTHPQRGATTARLALGMRWGTYLPTEERALVRV